MVINGSQLKGKIMDKIKKQETKVNRLKQRLANQQIKLADAWSGRKVPILREIKYLTDEISVESSILFTMKESLTV